MPGLLVTREVHAQIRAIIARNKDATNAEIADKAGVSDKTTSRIKRGGQSYVGYKRQLNKDHMRFTTDKDMPPAEHMAVDPPMVRRHKLNLLDWLVRLAAARRD